ncbi:MAG: hypothetical protein O9284_01560 [Steroidobacteraceae bacterium]|nr:hypothetical protein [Steroidobacteraceae bacterium]
MSITTRPPGSGAGPPLPPERPAAAGATGVAGGAGAAGTGGTPAAGPAGVSFGIPGAPGGGVAATGLRNGTLDLPAAMRVFAEEIRGLVVERVGARRADSLPRWPAEAVGADPGNSAATLLRWLKSVGAQVGIPDAQWSRIVDAGRARAEAVAAGGALDPVLRNTLASVRDALLRGLVGAVPGGRAGSSGAAAATGFERGGEPRATGTPTRPVPFGGVADARGALRLFAEEVRALATERLGTTRAAALPPLPPEAVGAGSDADAAGAALARWLRAAGAAAGVTDAEWGAAVQAGHARTEATLARAALEPAVREALTLARDVLVRGLQSLDDGGAAAPAPGTASLTAADPALRADLAYPMAVPGGGDPRRAARAQPRERIEAIGDDRARRGADEEDEVAGADDGPAPFGRGSGTGGEGHEARATDLQGPMDCIRRYFEAFQAGDHEAYAAQWVYPACFWSGAKWWSYPDAAACAAGNAEYERAARAEGMAGGRILMLRVEPLSPDAALVHGTFTRERADGSVIAEIEAAYTTVRTSAGWRVAACVVK